MYTPRVVGCKHYVFADVTFSDYICKNTLLMKDRLQRILTKEGIVPTRFAEIIGVQRSSISHILSGRNNPSFDMIKNIMEKFPKLNPEWLLLGKGEMYKKMVQTSLFTDNAQNNDPNIPESPNTIQSPPIPASNSKASENPIFERSVESVIVFYNDKTFTQYRPG